MSGWILRIGIIAVIVIGAFIFRDRISGSANDLKVGDCFDEPVGETLIKDVQHHPCTDSHTSEVIFVGNMPGSNEAYPSEAQIDEYSITNCLPAYTAYTGKDIQTEADMDIGRFYPTADGWKDGDRGVTCYAIRTDGAATTTSVKKAP